MFFEGLQLEPSASLSALAGWDADRLARVSRWHTKPNTGKEVVKVFAKTIMALNELHKIGTSLNLSQGPSQHGHRNSKTPNSVVSAPRPVASATLALPSICDAPVKIAPQKPLPSPSATRKLAQVPSYFIARPFGASSLPAEFWNVWRIWTGAIACLIQVLLTLAAWVPVVLIIVGLILLVSDSMLLLKLSWELLLLVPRCLRNSVAVPTIHSLSQQTLQAGQPMMNALYEPAPSFAHPSYAVEPSQAPSWWGPLVAVNVEVGGVGALYFDFRTHFT